MDGISAAPHSWRRLIRHVSGGGRFCSTNLFAHYFGTNPGLTVLTLMIRHER